MTREELEKEAEEYAKENYRDEVRATARNAYLDCARVKEKQIEIDAEQIRALQKQNGELTDELKALRESVKNYGAGCYENGLRNGKRKLEQQIERMKVKWHDLEKDPNDLPKDYKTMCICLSNFGSKYEPVPRVCVGYCDSLGWSDYMGSSLYSTVRYWCEIPLFKGIKEK